MAIFLQRSIKHSFASAVYLPQIRPSQSGIMSKRGNVEGCGLYH